MTFSCRVKRKLIRTFFDEQWSLLVCAPDGGILRHIAPGKDRFWADPFPVEYDGKTYLFVEQQIGAGNGALGFIELYPDLTHSDFVPILEKPYHLSFPNVFPIENEKNRRQIWYMVPETHENKTIDLYRAVDFPRRWEFEMTLMRDVVAVDTVVFCHGAQWWLFTSMAGEKLPLNGNFCAYYTEEFPTDVWTPHPLNPLCASLENSRMAGAVFFNRESGLLNRPAQNCAGDYGRETNINEIVELSPSAYEERLIKTIRPEKDLRAVCTHTINRSPNYLVRDIKTRRFKGRRP